MENPSELPIDEKIKILEVITTLRNYQLLGIIEARAWIEILWPEFGVVRDREADEMFAEFARIKAGRERDEENGVD
jgi:hypothetical protein